MNFAIQDTKTNRLNLSANGQDIARLYLPFEISRAILDSGGFFPLVPFYSKKSYQKSLNHGLLKDKSRHHGLVIKVPLKEGFIVGKGFYSLRADSRLETFDPVYEKYRESVPLNFLYERDA